MDKRGRNEMNEHPDFITEKPESFPIPVHIHERGEYDWLDEKAKEKGYNPIEASEDQKVEYNNLAVGIQNRNLHCGWICTFDDETHKAIDMLEFFKKKIDICKQNKEDIIVGFCITGSFAIGYTIYTKA